MAINRGIPLRFTQGDSVTWAESFASYPAPTWTLTYQLRSESYNETITAAADGTDHAFTITTAESQLYLPGRYKFQKRVDDGVDQRFTLLNGSVLVEPELATQAPTPNFLRQSLAAIEAAIQGIATKAQLSWTIDGTTINKISPEGLWLLRDRIKGELALQESAEKVSQGMGNPSKIQTRFI